MVVAPRTSASVAETVAATTRDYRLDRISLIEGGFGAAQQVVASGTPSGSAFKSTHRQMSLRHLMAMGGRPATMGSAE